MSPGLRGGLLLLACVAQLGVGASVVLRAEQTLRAGVVYRFRTAPVDPVDWFRGRYVALAFPSVSLPQPPDRPFAAGERGFARVAEDAAGDAFLESLHREPPSTGDYLAVEIRSAGPGSVSAALPFDRYYADERRAPELERAFLAAGSRALAHIRIREGHGVIEHLEIEQGTRALAPLDERLLRLEPERPLPPALLEAFRTTGPPDLESCGQPFDCVVFQVDLDAQPGPEWVLQDSLGQFHYYVPGADRAWRWEAHLLPIGVGLAPRGSALLEELGRGVAAEPVAHRHLRVGRFRMRVNP